MQFASVMSSERGRTDRTLAEVAAVLMAEGLRRAGVVQTNIERPGRSHCDMDVKVVPAGSVIRIDQELGNSAHGCRLDPNALETAVAQVEATLAQDTDILILNKFGKPEGEGRDFRALIAEALTRGIVVLTDVTDLNRAAFEEFSAELAVPLSAKAAEIPRWCRSIIFAAA